MKKAMLVVWGMLLLSACNLSSTPPAVVELVPSPEGTTPPPTAVPSATLTPTVTVTPSPTPVPHERYTGALLGGDYDAAYPERNRFGVRSDVFLIYVFDYYPTQPERNVVTVVSLPRDLFVEVSCSPLSWSPETIEEWGGLDRVNAAWAYGQFDCVKETIEANFDLTVNAPIVFTDFTGFLWVVGRLGTVTVTPDFTYSDWCGSYHGTAGEHGMFKTWAAGTTYHLTPNDALCYVRARANSNDLSRNRRELLVMQALADQYADYLFGGNFALAHIVNEVGHFWLDGAAKYLQLSMDFEDALSFLFLIPDAARAPRHIASMTLDETAFFTTPVYGASVLLPTVDLRGWMNCVVDTGFGGDPSESVGVCTQMWSLEGGDAAGG